MKYCPNCGQELVPGTAVCLSCGHIIGPIKNTNRKGIGPATVSVVFGSLGFYPLIIVGSIVGLICSIVVINDDESPYKRRAQIGLWLSIGSLALWIMIIFMIVRAATYY